MKKFLLLIVTLCLTCSADAQFSRYIITLKNKNNNPYSINDPTKYLSARSIARRIKQNISIDESDLPIVPAYLDSIRSVNNVMILNTSKWFNQVCIYTTDPTALTTITKFSFVNNTAPVRKALILPDSTIKHPEAYSDSIVFKPYKLEGNYYDYGNSYAQIHIHEGEFLHNEGFHGEGMLIGIIDAGFFHYNTNAAFDSVRLNGRILQTYDFVNNKVSVSEEDAHGMACFSIIASNLPGKLVGSCPNASFVLYKSEDVTSEYPIEEQNWVAAAEKADSAGADVLSTSLGYTTFDNPVFNHKYADLNGMTTLIAKANELAAKKGMISVVAAGNDGNNNWHFIGTPADADHILTVGAVNTSLQPAAFSSYGPAADGRVKPDIASVGVGTATASISGGVISGSGTSFATPNIAGLTTCLWQAFPEFSNLDIIDAIKKSSSIYNVPDNRIGYGIPNFHTAFNILTLLRSQRAGAILNNGWVKVFPNPFIHSFQITIKPVSTGEVSILIYDVAGKLLNSLSILGQENTIQTLNIPALNNAAKGIYTIRISNGNNLKTLKIMKQ